MKEDEIYPYYLKHLDNRLTEGKLSRGSFSLLRISESAFNDFKYRFENDKDFSLQFKRDKRIDDLFNDI
jgi:hypothetical protein